MYVPKACRDGTRRGAGCKLHLSLHGCDVNRYYEEQVQHLGFENWAEANEMVVLFPRMAEYGTTTQTKWGCWDGYGQTGADYALKSGAQMVAVREMIRAVAGV